jgi:hypothetical protein
VTPWANRRISCAESMQLVNPRWRDSSITMMAATRLSFHDAHHHERSDFQERGLGAVLA